MDYITMSVKCDRARSHGWWRNLVEHGAWGGPGATRVAPPDREALPGIAGLFGMSTEMVAKMVAADWYEVDCDGDCDDPLSPWTLRLVPVLERLSESDAKLVEKLVRRLDKGHDAGDRD